MASVPFRIKGLNTRRVVGATRGSLIWSQLGATLALVLTAFVLSAGVMSIAATTGIASYISGSLRVQDNPAMVLKGSFSLSARGRNLRSVLVGVQYLISFVLIICALFITL